MISRSRTKIGKHATIFIASEIQQLSRINIRKRHSKRLLIYHSYFGNHIHKTNIQNDIIPLPIVTMSAVEVPAQPNQDRDAIITNITRYYQLSSKTVSIKLTDIAYPPLR